MKARHESDNACRNKIAKRLDDLAGILTKYRILSDSGPLYRAANLCRSYSSQGKWGYNVTNLIFNQLGRGLKLFPHQAKNARLRLDMDIEGFCAVRDDADRLSRLVIELEIFSTLKLDNQVNTIINCWHFDRHEEGGNAPDFHHPTYHFQFGGNKLEAHLTDKPAHILLLDSPRLAHAPMDAILVVDFVITNFVGLMLAGKCRDDGLYLRLVQEVQQELWKPYIDNLYGVWRPNPHSLPWPPSSIWPQLVV